MSENTKDFKSMLCSLEEEVKTIKKAREMFSEIEKEQHKQTKKYNKLHAKLKFITDILAAQPLAHSSFNNFKQLIQDDFMSFANEESSLREEAEAVLKLQSIQTQIEMVLNFQGIYDKNIVAIGGGFSAGKSEFINSFFDDKRIKLPVGIEPVTALPTYIVPGKNNLIKGYTSKGGTIDIAPNFYKKLSHNFINSFGFNLKNIMPVMALSTPLAFKNICFIDTPGYNPSNTEGGFTSEDVDTAKEYLEQANVLLWLIPCNKGTIESSDLDFLEKLSLENKKFYVVANKADLKSNEDIESILDVFEEVLDDEYIEYEGISAYDSINSKEVCFRKKSILAFLKEEDKKVGIYTAINNSLNEIFDSYDKAINADIKFTQMIKSTFHSLENDFLEEAYEKASNGDNKVNKRINEMKKFFDVKELEEQLKQLKIVRKKIVDELYNVFDFPKSLHSQKVTQKITEKVKKSKIKSKIKSKKKQKKRQAV